jgi:diketogulonate reductase-like aldo/keto reductase
MTIADATGPGDTVLIGDKVPMPVLGLGVFLLSGRLVRTSVAAAVDAGYRHVDTASIYGNESDVGRAARDAPGGGVFVTTKLWNSDQGAGSVRPAFERSRRALGIDVVDLYLIHWPVPRLRLDSWRVMEELLEEGKVRAIGVSNYMERHLDELLAVAKHPPAVNQIELSPFCYRSRAAVVERCRQAGIVVQSFSPLTQGRMLRDPGLAAVAGRHGRSAAQVLIRWALQKGVVPLPRSTNPQRIAANADVFGFALTDDDMAVLDGLDRNLVVQPGWDPTGAP